LQDIYRDAAERDKVDRLLNVVSQRAGHWLALQIEEAKIGLSSAESVELSLERITREGETLPHTLTRGSLDEAIAPLVKRVETTVTALIAQAGVSADRIDTVFFTGGSSGVPLLRERIRQVLPKAQSVEGDLFGSIGAGLAVEAMRRFG
jgi:hypothetical chaperone protein